MELVATQEVRKLPSPSPSEEACAKRPFGLCPSRVVLSPSAVATGAVLLPGGGTAPSVDAYLLVANRSMPRPSTSQHTLGPIHSMNSENKPQSVPTVLVVEDDPDISMSLQDLLEHEGYRVDCAPTCRQASSSIEQHAYDVVLLDLGLPDGDGLSILEQLQVSLPALPVIVLTASNRDLGPVRAFARLTKPWERKELCRLLRQATGQTPSPIRI
jgi:CheY-like chemotaxis protein